MLSIFDIEECISHGGGEAKCKLSVDVWNILSSDLNVNFFSSVASMQELGILFVR